MTSKRIIQIKYQRIAHSLDEKSRRLWCAAEALAIESGGVAIVHAATGISKPTIYAGIRELKPKRPYKGKRRHPKKPNGRIRKKGGGTKSISNRMPEILPALEALIEPEAKGDPQSLLRWTNKALRKLSSALKKQGFDVCHSTVSDLVKKMGYSLQLNKKDKEGKSTPDRDAQFQHMNNQGKSFLDAGEPVISVDTKKKELIGEYKNGGREYRKKGDPVKVNVHDFPDKEQGKVAPYGVYDIGKNKG